MEDMEEEWEVLVEVACMEDTVEEWEEWEDTEEEACSVDTEEEVSGDSFIHSIICSYILSYIRISNLNLFVSTN
jgi:hypothetical protein